VSIGSRQTGARGRRPVHFGVGGVLAVQVEIRRGTTISPTCRGEGYQTVRVSVIVREILVVLVVFEEVDERRVVVGDQLVTLPLRP
jgi:hypothetical protein